MIGTAFLWIAFRTLLESSFGAGVTILQWFHPHFARAISPRT
jgi:hypothetical protein